VKALTPNNPTDEPDPAPFKVHLLTRAGIGNPIYKSQRRSKKARAFLAGLPTYANGSVERPLGGLSR
jgi:hypothetical protein